MAYYENKRRSKKSELEARSRENEEKRSNDQQSSISKQGTTYTHLLLRCTNIGKCDSLKRDGRRETEDRRPKTEVVNYEIDFKHQKINKK